MQFSLLLEKKFVFLHVEFKKTKSTYYYDKEIRYRRPRKRRVDIGT